MVKIHGVARRWGGAGGDGNLRGDVLVMNVVQARALLWPAVIIGRLAVALELLGSFDTTIIRKRGRAKMGEVRVRLTFNAKSANFQLSIMIATVSDSMR